MVWSRWIDEPDRKVVKNAFFNSMPLPIKVIAPDLIRRGAKKTLHQQGLGRHYSEEILQIARRDLTASSNLLATKDYFLIDKVAILDVCAYAFLSQFVIAKFESEFNEAAKSFTNLVEFANKVHVEYYLD